MKRKVILSIALVLSIVLVLLICSDSPVEAQNQLRPIADTGVINLGPNQKLRLTAVGLERNRTVTLRFRQMKYMEGPCNEGICKQTVESQTLSDSLTLAPNESAVVDAADYLIWRAIVLSNRPDVRVNIMIIDTATGQITSVTVAPVHVDLLG